MIFDGSQVLIGKGAQADVFSYHGYAYKVYRPSYPSEWIAFEKRQQRAVNQAGLSSIRYYDTDDDHIIRMDLIDGEVLETYAIRRDPLSFDILARAFARVHAAAPEGIGIPPLSLTAGMELCEDDRAVVLPVIERLSGKMKPCICHLDMHLQNIMLPRGISSIGRETEFTILDWMNARLAPAVFDYAKTYVLFDEFSKEALAIYKNQVLHQMWKQGVTEEDFSDAVKACLLIRKRERNPDPVV